MPLPHLQLDAPAHTLGLELEPDVSNPGAVHLTRHGKKVTLGPDILQHLVLPDPIHQRFLTAAILTGIRLALDQTELTRQKLLKSTPTPPLRAGGPQPKVVRYHEVASIYGERLLRLFPSITLDWCEAITRTRIYRLPWLPAQQNTAPGLEIAFVEESGRTLDLLTHEQALANPDPDKRLRDARAALFYDSYRIRPARHYNFNCGTIRVIKTTEGLGASRALILPEFDWNASQDHGFLAIPDRDTLLIAHPSTPHDQKSRDELHTNLHRLVQKHIHDAVFPLCDATFDLHIDHTRPHAQLQTSSLPLTNPPAPPTTLQITG